MVSSTRSVEPGQDPYSTSAIGSNEKDSTGKRRDAPAADCHVIQTVVALDDGIVTRMLVTESGAALRLALHLQVLTSRGGCGMASAIA